MLRYLLLVSLLAASLPAAAVYKWVDENGKVHYGDRVPPQYAKQQREVVNEQGLTTKTLSRQKTPDELAAEKKARDEAEAAAKAKKDQEEKDRLLVQTYPSLKDLDEARDERLKMMDSSLKMAQKSREGTEASLKQLLARKEAAGKNGGKVPPALDKQIKDHERKLKETDVAIGKMQQDRTNVAAKFEADRNRYVEIQGKAAQAAAPAATPAPSP